MLGRALRDAGQANGVVIASKVGGNFNTGRTILDFSRQHIVTAVEGSLRRLWRDTLDLYQLHNPSRDLIESGEVFDALDELKASDKIQYDARDNRRHWPPERRRHLVALANALRDLARPDVSLAQAALRFVLDEPAISATIVGIKTSAQARENFAAAQVPSFQELSAGLWHKQALSGIHGSALK